MVRVLHGLVCALAAMAALAQAQEPPAVEQFFRLPRLHDAQLSPSGQQLAAMAGIGQRRIGLFVFDLRESGKVRRAAEFADADIRRFRWVNEQRLVFDVIDRRAGSGDQPFAGGLFSVRPDGSEQRLLVQTFNPFVREMRIGAREPLEWNHVLLHVPRNRGDDVIVGRLNFNNARELTALTPLRLNVADGRWRSLGIGAPDHAQHWVFDEAGEARAVQTRHRGRAEVHLRGVGQERWERVLESAAEALPWTPAFFDGEGELLVRHAIGAQGWRVLSRLDRTTGRPESAPFISTPGFDVRPQLVHDGADGRLVGVSVETDAVTTAWFDAAMRDFQAATDRHLPGRVNVIACSRCGRDDMVALVRSYADRDPGTVWVYLQATQQWRMVGSVLEGVDPRRMAEVEFHRIRTRDGREMPLWLTLPARREPGKPLPAVVLVHGGPWVRGGHWHWEPLSQFLASRGYVVINPEFRGSTGYGVAHYRAGWRQWGQAMQDDVADALLWAVDKGHADRSRACIAGASYGGYATLMGLVRHPELYRCGVAWVAVTDPRLLLSWRSDSDLDDEARLYSLPTLIGDPVADAAMLAAVSPVAQAERLKAPLLLAFGQEDRRVPLVHGTRLREALRSHGREPEWVVYPEEGHGWLKVDNQIDFALRVERFLQQHLR